MAAEVFTWYDATGTATVLTDGTHYGIRPGLNGRLFPDFDFTVDEQYLRAGARVDLVKPKQRTLTLPIIVHGTSATDRAANLRALEYAFDPMRGPGRLKITTVDSAERNLDCYCTGWDAAESFDVMDCGTFFMFVATLMAPWPYWYSTAATVTWSHGGSWGPGDHTIAGDAQTYPTWVITPLGAMTQLYIVNNTTDKFLYLSGFATSDVITITTKPGSESIIKAVAANYAGYLSSDSTMFPFIPGINNITISANAEPTSIVATYYPAYHGV